METDKNADISRRISFQEREITTIQKEACQITMMFYLRR